MPYPDYRNSLVNLTSRLAANYNNNMVGYQALEHTALADMAHRQNVVLLVIDGLGYQYLQEHPGFLQANNQGYLTSVFPSTTASSISTFLTGQAPQQHGLTGWFVYLEEINEVTAVLPFLVRGSGELLSSRGLDIGSLYGHRPFFELLDVDSYIVSPDWIIGSEYNRSHSGPATSVPYTSMSGMCDAITNLVKNRGRKYIYAYWPDFDRLSHKYGNQSDVVASHFMELQNSIAGMVQALRSSNTLLIVTADHGFIDTTPDNMITVNDHPHMHECLRLPLCGEPRLAYCYLHEDRCDQFVDYVNQEFSRQLECVESSTLLAQGVFGQGVMHPRLSSRVGDYTLIMKENYVIKDWLPNEQRFFQYGVHGGTSEQEMYVPFIVIED